MCQWGYANEKNSLALCVNKEEDRTIVSGADRGVDLIDRHLPLVRALARRYAGCGEPLDDLVQVGSVGLVGAARRFDAARGVPFAAYAAPTIDGELRRYLRDRSGPIRIPRREQELAASLRREAQVAAQRLGREASLDETAAAAGVPLREARVALGASARPVSLTTLELRANPAAEEEIEACERRALVADLLAVLPPRERALVLLRFGGDLSQSEIARRLEISQSQASRLLAAALDRLRRALEAGVGRAA
jgi:RNA polymerase sigma-B factor